MLLTELKIIWKTNILQPSVSIMKKNKVPPLYSSTLMRNLIAQYAAPEFCHQIKDGTSKERMQLQEQRTVALLHIMAYFSVKVSLCGPFQLVDFVVPFWTTWCYPGRSLLSNSQSCICICLDRVKKEKYVLGNIYLVVKKNLSFSCLEY